MQIKRDAADTWFSKAIRERSDWTCEHCHKQFPENAQNLHCSHLFSRRHQSTRYDPANASAHCFSCHQYLGENPVIFASWAERHLGPTLLAELKTRVQQVVKRTKQEKTEIAAHYRNEYRRLRALREAGETGYLEIVGWD